MSMNNNNDKKVYKIQLKCKSAQRSPSIPGLEIHGKIHIPWELLIHHGLQDVLSTRNQNEGHSNEKLQRALTFTSSTRFSGTS